LDRHYICTACGTQFPPSASPPQHCAICIDERQFVPSTGQSWTTLDLLRREHRNAFQTLEPGILGIGTTPDFAIGQRALLIQTPMGNYLWDCIALLDDATIRLINALGGLRSIAISHPHYYTTMVEWSHAFGVPVFLHAADREWVVRPDASLHFWEGPQYVLGSGLTLIHCGGHFEGGTVLHWAGGAGGAGALLVGDVVQVVFDTRYVSFMRSYPNLVPLSAAQVASIAGLLEPLSFDRIYGAWWDRNVRTDAKAALRRSAARYISALSSSPTPPAGAA
jgi:glyoxylase-like metal-dependent hydrolase (beta-lactamase superfamily II)